MNSVIENTPTTSEIATIDAAAVAATAEKARELRKAARRMVEAARAADKKHERLYDPQTYITVDRIVWLMKVQDGCCYFYCGCDMTFGRGVNRLKDKDAVTLERIDSSLAHVADNCILSCMSCNRSKGHNMPFDVMRQWAVPIKQKVAKWCTSCKTVKSVTQFGRDRSTSEGLDCRCRTCNAAHCAQKYRKRKLAQIDESSPDETGSNTE